MYNRDSRIMRKLLGKAAPDSSAGDIAISNAQATIPATYRPSKSQNAVHLVGVPIACLDVSPDRHTVVLGGPHILKTLISDPSSDNFSFRFKEGIDVRAAITAQKSLGSSASLVADQLNIRDIKWHGTSTIFTACAAGRIFAYDIARLGAGGGSDPLEYFQIQEDARQVNTLDVNPHLQSWLLSGSQDGMVRIFDVSAPLQSRSGMLTFRQRFTPLKSNDPIRQVKWSPKVGHEMACCTDAGVVLKWDVRQPSRPLLRINAHDKVCSSIAWHSDGIHLISAGWDTKLHVWDLGGTADKRQKPKWTINTPAPVTTVTWRPGLWSATAQTRRLAQVAVTYDESSNRKYGASVVHIWDLARPTMPYKEIERFDNSPACLAWQDQDMLWTVGRDGMFNQCDVAFAPKVIDRQSTSAMAFSSRGDVVMFLDERPQAPRPHAVVAHDPEVVPRTPFGSVPNTPMLSVSRSDSEEDVMPSFLGPRRRSIRKRRLSGRSGLPMSTTPPSASGVPDDGKQVLGLEQSINVTGLFKTQQGMASGHVPAAKSVHVYQYLSGIYLETLQRELPTAKGGKSFVERVALILEQFAMAAEGARLYRLSQTWRILAYAMSLLLEKRAHYHLQIRTARFQKVNLDEGKSIIKHKPSNLYAVHEHGEETPRRPSAQAGSVARSLLSEEIESTSNVPTPVARPVDSAQNIEWEERHYQHGKKLTPIIEPESLTLGPPVHVGFQSPRQRHDSTPLSEASHESDNSKVSITEGYDFYDTEALAQAINVPMPKSSDNVHWEFNGPSAAHNRPRKIRHDSNESFGQMFSLSDGHRASVRRHSSSVFGSLRPDSLRIASVGGGINVTYETPAIAEQGDLSPTTKPRQSSESSEAAPSTQSPEEVFMISQTTMGTDDTVDTYISQKSFPSQSDSDMHQGFAGHHSTPAQEIQIIRTASPSQLLSNPEYDPSPHTPKDVSAVPISPLDPYALLTRALEFESRTSALNASAMVLLLKPLVPESVIDIYQATAVLRQHHSRLMGMSLFVEAALLRNLAVQGWPAGLPDWGENYTALFTPAQQGVKMGLFCSSCRKPCEVDPTGGDAAIWTCDRCHRMAAPCAVCGHREAELPAQLPSEVVDAPTAETWLTEWWYCPGCSHGGHASCLQTWHASTRIADGPASSAIYSDGCCPLDGCGHACLPGKYRGETTTARADELGRAAVDSSRIRDEIRTPGSRRPSPTRIPTSGMDRSVKNDANDVPQSKAVGMAREALNKSTGGILSSSPGRTIMSGERERRKSVKFAKPER
ncbi:putative WD repeat-containing C4F8.11-like protein [Cladobotryum mycophilum]|uniref:WD repeat-containing C4F8.11-like protein n=1 Tax=Cladobotryum mycophilum TaxID=491253 RepID=A0ABR0SJZ9_9HYPO